MKKKQGSAEYKLLTRLFFRLLPYQILLIVISAVNGIVDSLYTSNFIGQSAMSAIGLFGPFNHFLYAASIVFVSGSQIAANGGAAVMEAASHNPDIVLLDLGLPDLDGVEVIRKIRSWSNMPVIVISARSDDRDKIEALDAGADDYLTKPFSVDELLARLRATIRRLNQAPQENADQTVFVNGQLRIDYAAGCAYLNGEELHLTPIEYRLLCLLAKNCGKVLTHNYITRQVWGTSWENNVASLRVFMATLRKKVGPDPAGPSLIQTHVGIGYRMVRMEN